MDCRITSLGGIGEIGMNLYVYETDTSAIIVDCGVKFADSDDPAIDLIIPDFTYLEQIKDKLQCIFFTHGHEDHTGALPFLLKRINLPIVASRYTIELIKLKLSEFNESTTLTTFEDNVPVIAGDFTVSFIPISHSIHGTGALLIETADHFKTLHMSDYKIDFAPQTSAPFDYATFLDIGNRGLNCLLADSTSCLNNAFTKSEHSVTTGIDKVFEESKGRMFFTTFASNVERLQTVFSLAQKHNRKVALEGSSILRHINISRSLGLLKIADNTIVNRKSIEKLPDNEICVIATGSQGERNSVISKIAKNDFAKITVRPTDTFIFSSRVIPGNEKLVNHVINNITTYGGRCVTVKDDDVHVSGHAGRYDAELLLKLTRPDYLIPVHGERIHLHQHKNIAMSLGMSDENVIITENGTSAIFEDGVFIAEEEIPAGKIFIDNKNGLELTLSELKERRKLSTDGIVFLFTTIDIARGRMHEDLRIGIAGFQIPEEYEQRLARELFDASEVAIFERFNRDTWIEWLEIFIKKHFKKYFVRKPVIKIDILDKSLIENEA